VVEDGIARRIVYSPDFFSIPRDHPARRLPHDLGFAGFRVMVPGEDRDWLSFLGSSYFRSAGELGQYGLSARGIAINTGGSLPEEFPRFTAFWLEQRAATGNELLIYALLDGPSVTGAYRIVCTKAAEVVMEAKASLYARSDVAKMGVAPLTSMFWYSETNRHQGADWRPEVHDSDGLAMWTGAGERIWRPLNNPPHVQTSTFFDNGPRGFGLLQRDRFFHNYEDDGAFYNRRPSVWVEPLVSWGEGRVELVEIPTDDEIYDNIVAYWVPKEPMRQGSVHEYDYRLYWAADKPFPAKVSKVVATRIGRGGIPGQPRPPGVRKFMIDFAGGELPRLGQEDGVRPVITAARGHIDNSYVLPIVGTKAWRASFDLDVEGPEAVDLRCFLERNGTSLTETWLFQYTPFRYPGEPEQTPL
jgi:glucans biosynthesis protein